MSIVNEPNREPKPMSPRSIDAGRLQRPRRPLWRRWRFWFALMFLAILVGPSGWYGYHRYRAAAKLQAAEAELDRTEPAWRLSDLEAQRATLPAESNSALCVQAAHALLPEGWPKGYVCALMFHNPPLQEQLDEAEAKNLRDALGSLQPALQEARKLATMPEGQYAIAHNPVICNTPLSHNRSAEVVGILLYSDALMLSQEGDQGAALRSCRAEINAARSLGDEPMVMSQWVRMNGTEMSCAAIERVLAQGEPPEADLVGLQQLLEREGRYPHLLILLRSSRACLHELLEEFESGKAGIRDLTLSLGTAPVFSQELRWRDLVRQQHPDLLHDMTEALRIASLPMHKRAQSMRVLDAKVRIWVVG